MNFTEIHQQYLTEKAAADAVMEKKQKAKEAREREAIAQVQASTYRAVAEMYSIDEAELRRFGEITVTGWHNERPVSVNLTIELPDHSPIVGEFHIEDDGLNVAKPVYMVWEVEGYRPVWGEPDRTPLGQALDRAKAQYATQKQAQARHEQREATEAARYEERQAQRAAEKAERERVWSAVMNDEAGAILTRLWLMIVQSREAYQERLDEMEEAHWSAVAAEERRARNTQTELAETRRRLAAEEATRREAEDDLARAKQRDRR